MVGRSAEVEAAAPGGTGPRFHGFARRLAAAFGPWCVGLVGLATIFHPFVTSGWEVGHGGLEDGRLCHFTLEFVYQWLSGVQAWDSFWNAPQFYPHPNATAYTENLLGVGPLYWPWRWLGFTPAGAFRGWLIAVFAANFAAAYWMLRVWVGWQAACGGAYCLAFGSRLVGAMGHVQLLSLFYAAIAIRAVVEACRAAEQDSPRRRRWMLLATAAIVAQAWAGIYLAFFFGLLGCLTLVWAVAREESRGPLLRSVRQNGMLLAACVVAAGAALAPLAWHSLAAARETGMYEWTSSVLPRPYSWFLPRPASVWYGGIHRLLPEIESQRANGVGLLTTCVAGWGLWQARRRRSIALLGCASLTLLALATNFFGLAPWKLVYHLVPGAKAIRAVERVGLAALPLVALGVALAAERLGRTRPAWAIGLCLAVGVEQAATAHWLPQRPIWDHLAALSAQVDPAWEATFFTCRSPAGYRCVAEDAEWVALLTGVPTVNGRSGNDPPGWPFAAVQSGATLPAEEARRLLGAWASQHGLDPARVGWIEYDAGAMSSAYGERVVRRALRQDRRPNQALKSSNAPR